MKFSNWIAEKGGPKRVSRLLGINQFTIYYWLRGQSTPRGQTVIKLVKLGKGAFTAEDVIKETARSR